MEATYTVRHASTSDATELLVLMRELARFEGYIEQFCVTEDDLRERGLCDGSKQQILRLLPKPAMESCSATHWSMRCHVPALGARHSSLESRSQAYFGYNAGARKVSMADVILAFSCSLPASCISLWREPSMRTTQVP